MQNEQLGGYLVQVRGDTGLRMVKMNMQRNAKSDTYKIERAELIPGEIMCGFGLEIIPLNFNYKSFKCKLITFLIFQKWLFQKVS